MPFTVLPASSANADEIAVLLRRSIVELCSIDHGGNPERYEPWLGNKTAETVERWIHGAGRVFCAIDHTRRVIGVAMGSAEGEVLLNYVLPEARFTGVSKSLMRAVEEYFQDRGLEMSHLKSTATAENFYRSLGYVETGEPEHRRGMTFRYFAKGLN